MEGIVTKTIHYKLARYETDGKRLLEADLLAAFKSKRTTVARQQVIESGGETRYRLINSLSEGDGLSFGIVIGFTEGVSQQVVALQEDAEELNLLAIAPSLPNDEARAEFLDGLAYVGVKRNHVILLASQQLSASALETHLNWFLKDLCGTVPKGERLFLQDPVPGDLKRLRRVGVKEIRFDAPLEVIEEATAQSIGDDQAVVVQAAVSSNAAGWRVIQEAFKIFGVEPPHIDPMSGIPTEELSVSLLVRAKRSRTKSSDGHLIGTPVLDNLAIALRAYDNEEVPMTLVFKTGEEIRTSSLKVKNSASLEHVDGVLKGNSVSAAMRTWFAELIERKVVDP